MIDTHCHLYLEEFKEDMVNVIHEANAIGVHQILVPGIDIESSKESINIASNFPENVFPFVGIHPNYSVDSKPQLIEEMIRSNLNQIYAIGEIGLDFFREYAPHKTQIDLFEKMLDLAKIYTLPICIHNRDADEEIIKILSNWYPEITTSSKSIPPGVFHAYNGSTLIAEWGKAYGFVFGIGGPVTYKNSNQLRENVKAIGLDHLVLETDAPYLAPIPFRGKRNVPKYIDLIATSLSDLFNCTRHKIEEITNRNATRLFSLKDKMP